MYVVMLGSYSMPSQCRFLDMASEPFLITLIDLHGHSLVASFFFKKQHLYNCTAVDRLRDVAQMSALPM